MDHRLLLNIGHPQQISLQAIILRSKNHRRILGRRQEKLANPKSVKMLAATPRPFSDGSNLSCTHRKHSKRGKATIAMPIAEVSWPNSVQTFLPIR